MQVKNFLRSPPFFINRAINSRNHMLFVVPDLQYFYFPMCCYDTSSAHKFRVIWCKIYTEFGYLLGVSSFSETTKRLITTY